MRSLSLILAVAGFAWLTGDVRAMAIETGAIETAGAIPLDVLAAIKKATVFVKVQVQGRAFSGSGFVVKMDDGTAYVVTNHHVIEPHLVEIVAEWRTGPRPRTPREFSAEHSP